MTLISCEPGDCPELTLNFQDHGSIQAKLAFIFSSGGKSVVPLFAACAAMPRLTKFMPKDPYGMQQAMLLCNCVNDKEVGKLLL